MAKITVRSNPRVYNFDINGTLFTCQIDWKENLGVRPIDILISELEECLEQLKMMPQFSIDKPFSLPPLKPEDIKGETNDSG